ncbi:MAG: hypothetical protein ACRDQD_15355 [Nocardioidaceae bacterium]
MLYTVIFAGLAILVVVAVLVRSLRNKADRDSFKDPAGTNTPSHAPRDSAARKERKRRRAQSRNDRRKRH